MSVTLDRMLLVQLRDWVNQFADEIPLFDILQFETHAATGQQLWLQPLAGTTTLKKYVDGGYLGSLPFAIYSQLTTPEHPAQLDIPLWNLAEFFEVNNPQIPIAKVNKIEMTSTPNAFYRGEDGTAINQAIFVLHYTKGAERNWQKIEL